LDIDKPKAGLNDNSIQGRCPHFDAVPSVTYANSVVFEALAHEKAIDCHAIDVLLSWAMLRSLESHEVD
jgi:hypothetical protein